MKKEIFNFLTDKIEVDSKLAIVAGHYAIFADCGFATPGIYQDVDNPDLREDLKSFPYAGEFPLETLKKGLDMLGHFPNGKLVNLVNDRQFLLKNKDGNFVNESRNLYFQQTGIPCVYKHEIVSRGLSTRDVYFEPPGDLRRENNSWHISEAKLLNRYKNLKKYSSCMLGHSCAKEFLPFLVCLENAGFESMLVFAPGSCEDPTSAAMREGVNKLGLKMKMYSVCIEETLDIDSLWEDTPVYENGVRASV